MLLFKKKFLEAIRAGSKTQTVRLWKHLRMRAGQRSYIPGAGYICVTAIDPLALADLTDADAALDGLASAAALREEIELLYGSLATANLQAYRLRFELLPPEQQLQAAASKRRARNDIEASQ